MRKAIFITGLLLTALAGGLAQNSPGLQTRPGSPPEGSSPFANRLKGTVRVRLEKRLEMKKLKLGDEVGTKLLRDLNVEGETVLAKDSRFIANVKELMSRDKGDQLTRLGILFDHVVRKDGTGLPLYGAIAGVLVPQVGGEEGTAELQEMRLRRMRTEELTDTMTGETVQAYQEMYRTLETGMPTPASRQFNCQRVRDWLWCGPLGHSPLGPPVAIEGLPDVVLQGENTPQGPMGVLVSAKGKFDLNSGLDFLVRLVPRR